MLHSNIAIKHKGYNMTFATKYQFDIATIGESAAAIELYATLKKVGNKMMDYYSVNVTVGANTYQPADDSGKAIVFPTVEAAIKWVGNAANSNLAITAVLNAIEGSKLFKRTLYPTVLASNLALKTKLQSGVTMANAALLKAQATKANYDTLGYATSMVPAVVTLYSGVTQQITQIGMNIADLNAKIATL